MVCHLPMDPDSYVLGALLNACRLHGDVDLGKELVESLARRVLTRVEFMFFQTCMPQLMNGTRWKM